MNVRPGERIEAFLNDDRRWRIALGGGVAGGAAGAVGALVPSGDLLSSLLVTSVIAVGLALVFAVLLGRGDE